MNGRVKINVDGAWVNGRSEGNLAGADVVARNSSGRFVAARSIHLGGAESALCAEALAWRAALEFARTLELDAILAERDSYQLVQILGNKMSCPSNVEGIVEDVRRIAQQIGSCEFVFVRCAANGVAHKLAGFGVRGSRVKTGESRPLDWLSFPLGRDNCLF